MKMADEEKKDREIVIPHDVLGEQVLLAAVAVDWDGEGGKLVERYPPDLLVEEVHRALWAGLAEMKRRRLAFDPATLQRIVGAKARAGYLTDLTSARPDPPEDLGFFVDRALWDRQRINAAGGAVTSLLEALREDASPDRVRALARSVADAFAGGAGVGRYLMNPDEVVRAQAAEVRRRVEGHASYPYGVEGLDVDLETGRRRVLPGAAPGQVTIVTGVTGSGKSTFTAQLVLGLIAQERRVLYGAWEMSAGTMLELLACLSLGLSRSRLLEGLDQDSEAFDAPMSEEQQDQLRERMEQLSPWITFMPNVFRRLRDAKGRRSNDMNLDVLHEHIAASGCEVFVADLFRRCLADGSPEAEEDACNRMQSIAEETKTHHIWLWQQRLKDIEQRVDKRPTREGMKGSSGGAEVGDTIFGIHRPAMWKRMEDDRVEVLLLKQRYAKYPVAVEFPWDGDKGWIGRGRTIPYDPPGDTDVLGGGFTEPQAQGPRKQRRSNRRV